MIITTPRIHLNLLLVSQGPLPLCDALKSVIEAEEKKEAPLPFPVFAVPIDVKEEEILMKFLSVYPRYLFLFDETLRQYLLPQLIEHFKTTIFNSLTNIESEIAADFNQVTELFSFEQRRQLIDVFLPRLLKQQSRPVTFSGDPYCSDEYPRYDKNLGAALVALQDDLSADEIIKLSDYYFEYFDYEYGLSTITEDFKYLVPKLPPQQINKMLTALLPVVSSVLHTLQSSYWFQILNKLQACVGEDGKPLPLANEFLQVFFQLKMTDPYYNSLLSSVQKTLTSETREAIVIFYLDHCQFDLLAIMYDTLTLANRISVAKRYLEWIDSDSSTNIKSNHKWVQAIRVFKNYFGNSLEIYLNKIIDEADSQQISKIPLLTRLLPEGFKQSLKKLSVPLYDDSFAVSNVSCHEVNSEELNQTIVEVEKSLNSESARMNKNSLHNTFSRPLDRSIESLLDALVYCDLGAREKIFPLVFTAMGYNSIYKITFMIRCGKILDRQLPEEQTKVRAQLVALMSTGKFQDKEEMFSQILHKYLIHPNCNASLQEVANLPYRPGMYNKIRFLNTFDQSEAKVVLLANTPLASETCDIVLRYKYS